MASDPREVLRLALQGDPEALQKVLAEGTGLEAMGPRTFEELEAAAQGDMEMQPWRKRELYPALEETRENLYAADPLMGFAGDFVIDPLQLMADPSRMMSEQPLAGAGAAVDVVPGVGPALGLAIGAGAKGLGRAGDLLADLTGTATKAADSPRVQFPATEAPPALKSEGAAARSKYAGTPSRVKNRRQERTAINRYLELAEKGAPAADWYRNASESIFRATGERPGASDLLAGALGPTSANTALESNLVAGVRGYHQGMAGEPIRTHMPATNQKIQEMFDTGEVEKLGPKISPYTGHLRQLWDTEAPVGRAVHDIWDTRAWGYDGSESITEASHRWMDRATEEAVAEANKRGIGGRTDWDVDSLQAAAWSQLKADELGVGAEELAGGYDQFMPRLTGRMSVESMPSSELDNPLKAMDEAEQGAYHLAQEEILSDPAGSDVIAQAAGLAQSPIEPKWSGVGAWGEEANPVTRMPFLSGLEQGTSAMDPATRQLVESTAAGHGLLRGQAGVGYDFIRGVDRPNVKVGDINVATIPGEEFGDMVGAEGRMAELIGNEGVAVTPAPGGGANVLSFEETGAPFRNVVREEFPGAEFGRNTGDFVGSFEGYKPSEYMKVLDANPAVRDRIDAELPNLASNLQALMEQTGEFDEVYTTTLSAIAEGGLTRVRELVKQGVLPATVLGILGVSATQDEGLL